MTLPLFVLLGFVAFFAIALPRVNELFYVSLRGGRSLVVRGAIAPSLHQGIVDILRRGGHRDARVRALKAGSGVQLSAKGIDDSTAQRLRNFLGTHPSHALRAGYRPGKRNMGQRLGIEWLAWLLQSKAR